MSYNAICTSRIILEGLVFQEPYKRVEPSKRPCEHKTLESNKSLEGYPGQAGAPARPAGAELCEHAPAAGPETGQAAAPGRDDALTREGYGPACGSYGRIGGRGGERLVSANLTAEEICALAWAICYAAAPAPPEFAPDTSIEERAQRYIDWDIDSAYEDEHIRIAIGGDRSSKERKKGFEIYIGLANQPDSRETDHLTVFIVYEHYGDHQDSATEDVPIDVE